MHREEIRLTDGGVLEVRDMLPEDTTWVARLEEQTFSQPWSEHAYRQELCLPDRLFVVAYLDEEPAGYCGIIALAGEGDITNVAVAADFRRRGVGRAMLQTALKWGEQMDLQEFTLEVRCSNQPAILMYESLGFVGEGVRRNFYEKPREDALIMWKRQAGHGIITTEK